LIYRCSENGRNTQWYIDGTEVTETAAASDQGNTDPLVGRRPTLLVSLKIGTVRKSDVFHAAASFSEFYLKPWIDSAVKLQQFSLRRERLVIDKMHPSQICDQRDINTFEHSMLQNPTKKDKIWHTRLVVFFKSFSCRPVSDEGRNGSFRTLPVRHDSELGLLGSCLKYEAMTGINDKRRSRHPT